MIRCEQCGAEQSKPGLCEVCSSQTRTVAASYPSRSASRPAALTSASRFLPGDMLVGRYRIVALLGCGGMGEVYRADDLTLDQPVALKFLSAAVTQDESAVTRFRNEVRIARQVSHPNVCRVYDLAEVDGDYFLSMEYVDGEDLGSLLRRIGRLPEDKGLVIARQLCAGLTAAHERGVLHRDLKPGNVMLDGRGQVLLTDFGLAGIAGEIAGNEVRNGTPAYMAPEQQEGREVTVRSDIYSLGLVLHEIFTGRKPDLTVTPAKTPTSFVRDLDPAIDRVIMRCLEHDPANRPKTALAISATLPGGDPLAAALAAGQTPSPQMVAAAGQGEGLIVRTASLWTAAILIALTLFAIYRPSFLAIVRPPFSPEILSQKAREIIADLGYQNSDVDSAADFAWDYHLMEYAEDHDKPQTDWRKLATDRPPVLRFWYRQAESALTSWGLHDDLLTPGMVNLDDPPSTESGMISVELDPRGRLVHFEAIPDQKLKTKLAPIPLDWSKLFSAAQLDPALLQDAEPQWMFLAASDTRKAWIGTWPGANRPLRVEAAALAGRPVAFTVSGPWTKAERMPDPSSSWRTSGAFAFIIIVILTLLIAAPLFARRNLLRGSGDRQGAFRIAVFVFFVQLAIWLCRGHFALSQGTAGMALLAVCTSLFYGALIWVIYLAFEPQVRRLWPQTLISWSALLAGKWRDPVVGRDALYGIAMGLSWQLIGDALRFELSSKTHWPDLLSNNLLLGPRAALGFWLAHVPGSLRSTMIFFFLLFVFRVILKREWLATGLFVLIFAVILPQLDSRMTLAYAAIYIFTYTMIALVVFRAGLLALAIGLFLVGVIDDPMTFNPSDWYFWNTLFMYATVAVMSLAAFRIATRDQPFWQRSFFE